MEGVGIFDNDILAIAMTALADPKAHAGNVAND